MGRKKKEEIEIGKDKDVEKVLGLEGGEVDLLEMAPFTKKSSQFFSGLKDSEQARFTIDTYYQIQDMRINIDNKIRADKQALDNKTTDEIEAEKKASIIFYQAAMMRTYEASLKNILDSYSESNYLSRWARKTMGIGPVLAASLPAYFDLKKEPDGSTKMHAGSWWAYAGLNDNNNPWLGAKASRDLVNQAIEENGGKLDDETMLVICARSHWSLEHFESFKDAKKKGKWNKDAVIKASSVIPYNKKLKVVMYKIGCSFHKLCNNDKSLYGRLFKERLQYEVTKNERGDYADQAKKILETKNFSDSDTKKCYESGKLPTSHLYARCERYVTKLFISHAFEAAYYNEYGCMPPQPYALCFCEGHSDYIGPEVPYDSVPRDCEMNK